MGDLFMLLIGAGGLFLLLRGLWAFVVDCSGWFGQSGGSPHPRGRSSVVACPGCHGDIPSLSMRCPNCDWTVNGDEQAELTIAQRQVRRLKQLKLLDDQAADRVLNAIATRRETQANIATGNPLEELLPSTFQPVIDEPPAPAMPAILDAELLPAEATVEPAAAEGYSSSPADRVRRYIDRRQQLPSEPGTAPQPQPRRRLAALFNAFLDESNIRWGELVGGLLIVGCSIALVLSFWSAIDERPLLKFLVFNGLTASLFGVGLYTAHRWRLPHTSGGLLAIGTLLVPLNFLAIAAFSSGNAPPLPLLLGGELLSIALFGALMWLAGRTLVPPWPWALALGVVGCSAAQLLIRRFATPDSGPLAWYLLAAVPLGLTMLAQGRALLGAEREAALEDLQASHLLKTLGLVSFATLIALGLLVHNTGEPLDGLRRMAPLLVLAGVPALATGLMCWRRLQSPALAGWRLIGTAVAVAGAAIQLSAVAFAWPSPIALVAVALANAAVLAVVANRYAMPAAHLPAALLMLVAGLMASFAATGDVPWWSDSPQPVIAALGSASTGVRLVPLVLLLASGALAWRWSNRHEEARCYALAAVGGAAVSIATVAWYGWGLAGDPHGAAWVLALYAAAALAGALIARRAAVAWIGAALLWAALTQALVYRYDLPIELPWIAALASHAALCVLGGLAVERWQPPSARYFGVPLSQAGLITSSVAVVLTCLTVATAPYAVTAAYFATAAVLWLLLAIARPWPALVLTGQAALYAAIVFATAAVLSQRAWFAEASWPWLHYFTWVACGTALATVSAAWSALRWLANGWREQRWGAAIAERLAEPLAIDRVVTLLLTAAAWLLPAWLVLVSCLLELSGIHDVPLVDYQALLELAAFRHGVAFCAALLALALAIDWRTAPRSAAKIGLICLSSVPVLLLAGAWHDELTTSTALRWLAALWLALGSAAYLAWDRWQRRAEPLAMSTRPSALVPGVMLALSALGILGVTLPVTSMTMLGTLPMQPHASWPLAALGGTFNYVGPLCIAAAVLVAFSLQREAGYALAAALVAHLAVSLGWLMEVAIAQAGAISFWEIWQLAQLNAAVAGGAVIVWLLAAQLPRRRDAAGHERFAGSSGSLRFLLMLGWLLNGLAAIAVGALLLTGEDTSFIATLGQINGWLGWLACAVALVLWRRSDRPMPLVAAAALASLTLSALLAATAAHWDTGNWLAAHTLLASLAASGWLLMFVGWRRTATLDEAGDRSTERRWTAGGVTLAGLLTTMVAFSGNGDPQAMPWAVGALLAMFALATTLGAWLPARAYHYIAAGFFQVAALIAWYEWGPGPTSRGDGEAFDFCLLNVLLLGLLSPLWVWLERRWVAPRIAGLQIPGPHRAAAVIGLLLAALLVGAGVLADFDRDPIDHWPPLMALGLTGVLLAVGAAAYDPRSHARSLKFYLLGLIALGAALDQLNLPPTIIPYTAAMLLAAWTLGTGYLFSRRRGVRLIARRLGVPHRQRSLSHSGLRWLAPANVLLVMLVLAIAAMVVLTFDDASLRQSAGLAAVLQGVAVALLARGQRRGDLQFASLAIATVGGVLWSWAFLQPLGGNAALAIIHCAALASAVLVAMLAFNGLALSKLLGAENRWARAAFRMLPVLAVLVVVALGVVLSAEVWSWLEYGQVFIAWQAILVVALALGGLIAALLGAAVLPGRDPLRLSEPWRSAYVYAAEAAAGLLFLHIRLSMPWLFSGFFAQYWPLIVMGLAFLGVGLGELFRRQQRGVLAVPLERTGVLLPLLPVLGFWVMPAQVNFSLLMFVAGGLYAALAVMRRSFGFGVVAALAANGGLWYLLHTEGYGLLEQPQVWLIPPALCVLAAAYLNRDRLSPQQMVLVRYLSASTIYLSSTADIFLTGVRDAPWLPLVLAGLSLAGIFAGILMRVQAFLMLGVSFLLLSVMTMIWHAAVNLDQTWIWWISGIAAGIVIIAVFAALEKKRSEVLQLVDQLKQWEH